MNLPAGVHYHQQHFAQGALDDEWLPLVGAWGWTVIGQDHSYHKNESETAALKHYSMGCFYLWGAEAKRWDTMRLFARTYDKIELAAETTTRPFLYYVLKNGQLRPQAI